LAACSFTESENFSALMIAGEEGAAGDSHKSKPGSKDDEDNYDYPPWFNTAEKCNNKQRTS